MRAQAAHVLPLLRHRHPRPPDTPSERQQVVLANRSRVSTTTAPAPTMPAMATLRILETITDLNPETPSLFTEGSGMDTLRHTLRGIIEQHLHLIDGGSLTPASRQGKVSIVSEIGVTEAVLPSDDSTGFINFDLRVTIPDELVYDFQNEAGPVAAFVTAVKAGVSGAFAPLPDFAHFVEVSGIGGSTITLSTSVILNG